MKILGYVFIILVVGVNATLLIAKGILFYHRNLRTYKDEIREWLQTQSFELVDTRYPTNQDWIKSPFLKPSKFDEPLNFISDSGMKPRHKDYLIIIGKDKNRYKEFWMEIDTRFGSEPKLNFRSGKEINLNEKTHPENKVTYIKVADSCPACSCKLNNEEKICPECGLYFE